MPVNNTISKIKAGLKIKPIKDARALAVNTPAKNKLKMTCAFSELTKLLPFNLEN